MSHENPPRTKNAALATYLNETLPSGSPPGLINKEQLAELLSMTPRGIDSLMQRRKIPFIRLGHRTVRFNWEHVQAALAKREVREL